MISAISSTPILHTTRAVAPQTQTQQGDTSDALRGTEDAQRNRPERDTEVRAASEADISELASTDREVRAHEAAHLASAGGLAQGGATFETVRGPDGRSYAVGGEVSIDISPGRTPEETIAKAQQIRSAALAPADPSAQDFRVAAQAAQMAQQAQQELATQQASQQTRQPGPAESREEDASGTIEQSLSGLQGAAVPGAQVNIYA